ncbi:Secreted RxLR effector peptide protein [Phytophthora palmivora]|uniref:Secreted RxLR effector peptide protein n=1 Tax=Phytophthora palmivora TaxID=4796 RepID=A0A2P4XRE0_9STRA|nr:Secreted RxLR effector peptide protein [Phytophthora palmivora]
MYLCRYLLLLLVLALVGSVPVVFAIKDVDLTAAADVTPFNPARAESQGHGVHTNTKRLLRQEKINADIVDPSRGEERAIIASAMKNSLYRLMAALGIRPQTLFVQLRINTGRAPYLLQRFYHSYQRWYAGSVNVFV